MKNVHRWVLVGLLVQLAVGGACSPGVQGSQAPGADVPGTPVAPPAPVLAGPITFADVSAAAGIDDVGISFGASAGDVDGDGWVDIFTGGHYEAHPRLWHNQQDGTFVDVTAQLMQPIPNGDLHGAQWVDIDNDGRQELVLMRGANYGMTPTPKLLYMQCGNQLLDVAGNCGLDVPEMRARTPLAVDYDRDGRIDLFLTAMLRPDGHTPPSLYRQVTDGYFADTGPAIGFDLQSPTSFAVLGDLDGDHRSDVLFHAYPTRAFSLGGSAIVDITPTIGLPSTPTMQDAVIADFTGDGENEIYVARDRDGSAFHREGDRTLEFRAVVSGSEHQVRFPVGTSHVLYFDWGPPSTWPPSTVFVGANGYHPIGNAIGLDPTDPSNTGTVPHNAGQDTGIYIGWDPTTNEWSVACSAPVWAEALMRAIASAPIQVPYAVGFNPSAPTPSDRLLVRTNGQYIDAAAAAGIPSWLCGRSVVAADFDNDMDLDLYVVTSTPSRNTDNVLLENDGTGCFSAIPAGPAAGSSYGIGDSAITLDYDRDGFVDLFLVNGGSTAFRQSGVPGAFGDDGPAQLLRNVTANGNHWLAIDLVGTISNRDAIGARIKLRAGGRGQVREQGGGMHRYSQNHGIHFGLGDNTTADVIEVHWPSGRRTTLHGVAADQYLTVIE